MTSLNSLTTSELIARMKQLQSRTGNGDVPIQRAEDKATLRQIASILERRRTKA